MGNCKILIMGNTKSLIWIIIFICSILYTQLQACNCKTVHRDDEYNYSDYIFIGKVLELNSVDGYFTIIVDDIIKGNEIDTLYGILEPCSIYPNINDEWLFIGRIYNNDTLFFSQCGYSRNFNSPRNLNMYSIPGPLPGRTIPYTDSVILSRINKVSGLNEVYFDVLRLQLKRKKEILANLEKDQKSFITVFQNRISILILLNIVTIIGFVIICTLVLLKWKSTD